MWNRVEDHALRVELPICYHFSDGRLFVVAERRLVQPLRLDEHGQNALGDGSLGAERQFGVVAEQQLVDEMVVL